MSRQPVYSLKGAALYLAVCAFLIATGGTVLYVSGEEALRCERSATGDAACRLTRRVGPLHVRQLDLGTVTAAELVEVGGGLSASTQRPTGSLQPRSRASSYVLDYRSELGRISSRAVDERDRLLAIRSALTSFLADPDQRSLEEIIPAESAKIAWSVFVLGGFLAALWLLGFLFPSLRSEV